MPVLRCRLLVGKALRLLRIYRLPNKTNNDHAKKGRYSPTCARRDSTESMFGFPLFRTIDGCSLGSAGFEKVVQNNFTPGKYLED